MECVPQICRVCLNITKDYISFETRFECDDDPTIPQGNPDEINYLQCLRLCTNLPIDENVDAPQGLCTECGAELQIVYKFLQKVKNAQTILEESWLRNCSKEIIEHTEIAIEKCDEVDIIDTYSESLDAEESNHSKELSNEFDQFSNDGDDSSKDFFQSTEALDNTDDCNMDDSFKCISDYEKNEFFHENEGFEDNNKTSQNNSYIFIPKKYKCHICNRAYTTERLLKVHLSYHKRRNVGSKPYGCKICGESFSLQRYLTQHMIEHEDCREIHKCQYCDKEYVSKTALTSHKRIHQGETLTCSECGKQFNGSYEFSVHQRFHRREKAQAKNKCEICYKQYSLPRRLSQHMLAHFGEREIHTCNYCNKQYVSKSALSNHKRLHDGQTTDCNLCGEQFNRNCELKVHMRFHKTELPFKCTVCEQEFTLKKHLSSHMCEHQGIEDPK